MKNINRREFIKMSAATAAVASVSAPVTGVALPSQPGEASVWTTHGSLRHAKQEPLRWTSQPAAAENPIKIDPSEQYQELLGFGAAFTDAACFTLHRLEQSDRKALFQKMFGPSEMNLSVSRICIGASDYSRNAYSYSEGSEPDPELKGFSIAHDREYILPILREARGLNPDMWLLASPWSPPAWMKFNKSMLGGSMRRKWLSVYAQYFDKFLQAYANEGVKINSVTPQNEVDTDQDGRMPACIWPQEYEVQFVRDHLGPAMANSKNPADIWILDHNYNLWGRAICELEDAGARKYIKGVAWHGYVGTPESMTHVRRHFKDVDMFWTEGGPDFEQPGYDTEWANWGAQFAGILRNWARSIIAWNYALDEQGNPNIGPFKCAGLVTVDSKTRSLTYSGQYWAMQHFSAHMKRGARIVKSEGALPEVQHVVAKGTDGAFTAVLTNTGRSERRVALQLEGASLQVALPADSVTTIAWV